MDAALFVSQRDALEAQLTKLRQSKLILLSGLDDSMLLSSTKLLMEHLEKAPPYLWTLDETIFVEMVDKMLVGNGKVTFQLKNTLSLTEVIPS